MFQLLGLPWGSGLQRRSFLGRFFDFFAGLGGRFFDILAALLGSICCFAGDPGLFLGLAERFAAQESRLLLLFRFAFGELVGLLIKNGFLQRGNAEFLF